MKAILVLTTALGWLAMARSAEAPARQPLTLERYSQLSVERLELSRSCWYWLREGPSPGHLQRLWDKYQTTEQDFVSFSSKHARDVDDYLAAHPELKNKIEVLSADTRQYIQHRARDRVPAKPASGDADQTREKGLNHETK